MERTYRRLLADLESAGRADAGGNPQARERLVGTAMDVELLQFGRLRHFLRHRTPEAVVGGSLLVFRLTDAEVFTALFGRVPGIEP